MTAPGPPPPARGPLVACFAMDEAGHMSSLLPVVSGLTRHGARCVVYTHARYRPRVEAVGARFVDVFAGRPLAGADDVSWPFPCRYVSFAGRFGDDLLREVEALAPDLIVYDTFAVVARAIGHALDLPHVAVCAGHDVRPDVYLPRLRQDPRVRVADACRAAVEVLRRRFGLRDASPFAYVDALSPHLNLACEPPEFVDAAARAAFAPVADFGCLPDLDPASAAPGPAAARDGPRRLYASFGTVVARYFRPTVIATLAALVECTATRPDLEVTVSLGGLDLDADERRRLAGRGVRVAPFVDGWATLATTDVVLTHQGLHSTHEAIYHRVPMVAYPFFWDQPALAARCEELGVSVRLGDAPLAAVTATDVARALDEVRARRDEMQAALARAQAWEVRTLTGRPATLERVLGLAGPSRQGST